MAWRSKAQTSNGMARKSWEKLGKAMAMDARRSFDKQRQGEASA